MGLGTTSYDCPVQSPVRIVCRVTYCCAVQSIYKTLTLVVQKPIVRSENKPIDDIEELPDQRLPRPVISRGVLRSLQGVFGCGDIITEVKTMSFSINTLYLPVVTEETRQPSRCDI